jgi:hypothetical protein
MSDLDLVSVQVMHNYLVLFWLVFTVVVTVPEYANPMHVWDYPNLHIIKILWLAELKELIIGDYIKMHDFT